MIPDYLIVLNPVANHKKAEQQWLVIKNELENTHTKYRFRSTTHPHHAESIVYNFLLSSFKKTALPKAIIIIGGDGTVNEVLNGAVNAHNKGIPKIPLLVVPAGHNNYFAKKLALNNKSIIKRISNLNVQEYSLGMFYEHIKNQRGAFINNLGIGLDANMLSLRNNTRTKHNMFSKIKYYLSIFPTIYNLNTFQVKIITNSQQYEIKKAFMVSVSNHDLQSNQFNLNILYRKNIFQLFYILLNILIKGNHFTHRNFSIQSSSIRIEIPSLEYGHADEEALGSRFYDIEYHKMKYPFI